VFVPSTSQGLTISGFFFSLRYLIVKEDKTLESYGLNAGKSNQ
jgi:hypothetical protein